MVYQSINHRKRVVFCFFATLPLLDIFVRDGGKDFVFFETLFLEISESFEDEINVTNKEEEEEEAKTVEKLGFVKLSEDDKIYNIKQIKKLSCVLRCDKTLQTFENTGEM